MPFEVEGVEFSGIETIESSFFELILFLVLKPAIDLSIVLKYFEIKFIIFFEF
ncbi:hypothetical protein CKA32_004931 [Geitlerinema sp. FC II]|nr:hypothetical protein CKA32_004931 [Geitlerinema sp. FC II]